MAALPPLTQLAGNHGPLFEGYWSQLDATRTGRVDAATAAAFLKKSQLRELVLHKIWSLSDPNGTGYLDKQGFFLAMRLVAACQTGKEASLSTITLSDPPPRLVGVEVQAQNRWVVEPEERRKFDQAFQNLQPVGGLLSGDKVKPVMLASKLPVDMLGKIWSLADIDRDGSLDVDEFAVAMQLIRLCQSGETLPTVLPSLLIPPSKVTKMAAPSPLQPSAAPVSRSPQQIPSPIPMRKTVPAVTDWVVTPDIKAKYDGYFEGIDKDHDGIVSGDEARHLFMASNLPHNVLAHIWTLCDIESNGKLNAEQFALAMFLIAEKVRGKDPPKELAPSMVPPSLRKKHPQIQRSVTPTSAVSTPPMAHTPPPPPITATTSIATAITSTSGATPTQTGFANDFTAIKELDSISSEIESIRSDKSKLQEDIRQKQEMIQERKGEIESLQVDVQKFSLQKDGLQREKEEAQRELEQLEKDKAKFEGQISELKQKCKDEQDEIERLRSQLSQQESSKKAQSEEVERLTEQLDALQTEEMEYKHKVEVSAAELEKLQKANQNLQNEITQVRQKVDTLKEEHRTLTHALTLYPPVSTPSSTPSSSVVNINDVGQLSGELNIPQLSSEPDAISARATAGSSSPVSSISGFSTNSHLEEAGGERYDEGKDVPPKPDPFATTATTTAATGGADPFAAFAVSSSDPFASTAGGGFSGKPSDLSAFDPFSSSDLFKATTTPSGGLGQDLFKSDPFSSGPATPHASSGAADPFSGQDPFASDPFSSGKASGQPTWSKGSFGMDPFSTQPSAQTPTAADPFSTDPFADDPFAPRSSASTSNPFAFSSDVFGSPSKPAEPRIPDPVAKPGPGAQESERVAWAKRESEREAAFRLQAQQKEEREFAKAMNDSLRTS